jgi:Arc/MetJ-type ribon-helix-helix transcriptional regulator
VRINVSLPDDDVTFVDQYAAEVGVASRSAAIHRAIELLRSTALEEAYASTWREWEASEDAVLWNTTLGDGIAGAEPSV